MRGGTDMGEKLSSSWGKRFPESGSWKRPDAAGIILPLGQSARIAAGTIVRLFGELRCATYGWIHAYHLP